MLLKCIRESESRRMSRVIRVMGVIRVMMLNIIK